MTDSSDQNKSETPEGSAEGPPPRRSGVLAGIIRTAKATSTHVEAKDASMKARTCRTCGAGRPEGTDLTVCAYCGDRFMTADAEESVDD